MEGGLRGPRLEVSEISTIRLNEHHLQFTGERECFICAEPYSLLPNVYEINMTRIRSMIRIKSMTRTNLVINFSI